MIIHHKFPDFRSSSITWGRPSSPWVEKFGRQVECNIQADLANLSLNHLSQWISRLSVQTQSHKSPNSDSSMFGDPLMRVGHRVQGKAEDESL